MNGLSLGDMYVAGNPPAKLTKALAVISTILHPAFSRILAEPEKSKQSCVLCSLTVRDFLFKVGYLDVYVAPVVCVIRAKNGDTELHSLGIGDPDFMTPARKGRWNGHMVAVVPSSGYLIDTTMYQAARPQWPSLPGMMAAPMDTLAADSPKHFNLKRLSGLSQTVSATNSVTEIIWLDQPKNRLWKDSRDTKKDRRSGVVAAMVDAFGDWSKPALASQSS